MKTELMDLKYQNGFIHILIMFHVKHSLYLLRG